VRSLALSSDRFTEDGSRLGLRNLVILEEPLRELLCPQITLRLVLVLHDVHVDHRLNTKILLLAPI
jgi:hypothetical protein